MSNAMRTVFREGHIVLLDQVKIPEGTELRVTPVAEDTDFWLQVSAVALKDVWDNSEDDVYAELLKK